MMKRMLAAAAGLVLAMLGVLAATVLVGDADAQGAYESTSANDVVPMCKKYLTPRVGEDTLRTAWGQGVCHGIISSQLYVGESLPPHLSSCPPNGVTIGQTVRVVLAYIERRPQRMHENFRALAIEAMHQAWPCN
jgi:hypothetical protein